MNKKRPKRRSNNNNKRWSAKFLSTIFGWCVNLLHLWPSGNYHCRCVVLSAQTNRVPVHFVEIVKSFIMISTKSNENVIRLRLLTPAGADSHLWMEFVLSRAHTHTQVHRPYSPTTRFSISRKATSFRAVDICRNNFRFAIFFSGVSLFSSFFLIRPVVVFDFLLRAVTTVFVIVFVHILFTHSPVSWMRLGLCETIAFHVFITIYSFLIYCEFLNRIPISPNFFKFEFFFWRTGDDAFGCRILLSNSKNCHLEISLLSCSLVLL